MSYEPLHHKYRPQTFANLVGQEAIATTLSNAIRTERIAPAYLFSGPRGTGKTSSARILAKSLNCLEQDKPTDSPCGRCEVCKSITSGTALDVIEIDAASNTGVDNIRELIEKSQFAPVQCRYKVYVIDECLTGDSLVLTSEGLIRIDDPSIKGKKVLSYNEFLRAWEFKKVLRWLDQGVRETLVIKTTNREIRCTGNHLIRTEGGWTSAKNVKEGMKILSPVNVDAALSFTNMGQMDACEDSSGGTNSREIPTARSHTTWHPFSNKQKPFDPSAPVDVDSNWISQLFYNKKVKESGVFSHTGKNILIKKDTGFGSIAQKSLSPTLGCCNQTHLDLSTELCLGMAALLTQTNTVDFPDCAGHMEINSGNGWNTKLIDVQNCAQRYELYQTRDTEISQSIAAQPVILNLKKSLTSLNHRTIKKLSLQTGFVESPRKDWPGGTWMMAHSSLVRKEAHQFTFIQKDTLQKKTKSLPVGLQKWATQQQQDLTNEELQAKFITTQPWEQTPVENGWQIYNNIQFLQWSTNLERVESVRVAGIEKVYDIEVEDNHNFVANGLLVHNCHMLSVAAFNALLKTLEEPPKHVVFVLATTDPQRVLPTIISRCQRFDFRRIPLDAMVGHLQEIAAKENIDITIDAVTLVAQVAQGGLRDAESLLDQLSLLPEQVTVEAVWDLVGAVPERDLMALTTAIYEDNSETVLDHCRRLMDRGREPLVVLQNLAGFYRDLLIAKTAPNRNDLVAVTPPTWKQLCEFAQKQNISRILQGQQHLKNSEAQIKNTTQPRLWLEVTLLGLLPSANPVISPSTLPASRQESPTRSESGFRPATTGASSPHNSTVQPAPSVKQASSPVTSQQSEEKSSPPPTVSTSVTHTQPSQVPSQQPSTASPSSELTSPSIQPEEQPSEQIREANTPAANPFDSEQSIDQIWQQVLSALQPFATQALLRQHCQLVSFEGSIANVVISSKPLMKLAQDKLPNIEAAFEAVYNSKVKVRLQTKEMQPARAATRESTASSTLREPTPQNAIAQSVTHAASTVTTKQVSPAYKPEQKLSASSTLVQSPGSEDKQSISPTYPTDSPPLSQQQLLRMPVSSPVQSESPAPLPVTESPASFLLQDVEWATEEIEKALGNLKQFFEGEIIDLNNDFKIPELSSTPTLESDENGDDETEIPIVEEEDEELSWVEPADSPQWQTSQPTSLDNTHPTGRENLQYDDDGDIAF